MKAFIRLATLCVFFITGNAHAQDTTDSQTKRAKWIDDATRRMNELIETKDFQDPIVFSKFLERINAHLSKHSKYMIRLDREAFGKDLERMLKEEVVLPDAPSKVTVLTALKIALSQVTSRDEIEYSADPAELIVTNRDRSLYTTNYDVRDLLPHTQRLYDEFKQFNGIDRSDTSDRRYDPNADPRKPAQWLARQAMSLTENPVAGWHNRTPASTIRVSNSSKLVVHAPPSIQHEIALLFDSMRQLLDVAVVMNARLYAIDRKQYDADFAPAFVDPKDKSARKLVATVSEARWKTLQAMKPILQSESDKLTPYQRASFLSAQNAYQYQARPSVNPTTAFEGMSFAVRPVVSPDRRCLRLELFHNVEQLVKLTKGTMVDMKTGKDLPIEIPNLRKSSASATVEIHDGQPILLAVDYRPKDKVWLVLAEPRIYIHAEEEEIRKASVKPMLQADEKPAPEPAPEPIEPVREPVKPPPVQLRDSDDVKQILEAVIESILTDPKIDVHDFYGTRGDKKFGLDNHSQFLWPKNIAAAVAGYSLDKSNPTRCRGFEPRLMGLRIDGFDWDGKKDVKEVSIDIAIHNVGGQANGGVIGACHVYYTAKKKGKRWIVQWSVLECF